MKDCVVKEKTKTGKKERKTVAKERTKERKSGERKKDW